MCCFSDIQNFRTLLIDVLQIPDGHTTPGDATEEDQGDDAAVVQKAMGSSDNKAPNDEASQEKPIPAEEKRLDDTIDEVCNILFFATLFVKCACPSNPLTYYFV